MSTPFAPNKLYYGDCLDIMSGFPDGSIELICLDPPFNSEVDMRILERALLKYGQANRPSSC
jgi:DNA modification methylase